MLTHPLAARAAAASDASTRKGDSAERRWQKSINHTSPSWLFADGRFAGESNRTEAQARRL